MGGLALIEFLVCREYPHPTQVPPGSMPHSHICTRLWLPIWLEVSRRLVKGQNGAPLCVRFWASECSK